MRVLPLPLALGLLVAPGAVTPRAQTAPDGLYAIEDLSIAGAGASTADAIDWDGAVVGSTLGGGVERAFLFAGGRSVHLDTIGGTLGGARSAALGVRSRRLTGWSIPSGTAPRGFVYDGTRVVDLGTLGGASTVPYDINAAGWVAGAATLPSGESRAFLFNGVSLWDIAGRPSTAYGVNDAGWVTGSATFGGTSKHAFLYDGTLLRDLGTLGGASSVGRAINGDGVVVGAAQTAGGVSHAFVYTGATLRDLGTFGGASSEAFGLNAFGDVVGTSATAAGAAHAFLWRGTGRLIDLNTLIDPASGWVLTSATAINQAGQIVGQGTLRGIARAFRLTPPQHLRIYQSGLRTDRGSNRPRPVQTGNGVNFVTSFLNDGGGDRYDAVLRVTTTSTFTVPVEVLSAAVYDNEVSPCTIDGQVVTCEIDGVGDGQMQELAVRVRPLVAGPFEHHLRATTLFETIDAPPEDNTAVSLASATQTPTTVAGGRSTSLEVTLTSPAPNSDARVRLASSDPAVVPVPATLAVLSGSTTRAASLKPRVVALPTTVELSATYGLVTRTTTVTVVPPALTTLTLSPTTVIGGCSPIEATARLTGSAPAAGAAVAISEALAAARFPASIVVPGGSLKGTLSVPTDYVTAMQRGVVTATYGGASGAITLTVRPIHARSMTLAPTSVSGGAPVTATITLECAAPTPVVIPLTSSQPTIAAPTVASVTIPAGALTATFPIRTTKPPSATSVHIDARVHGTRARATLTVTP